MAGINGGFHARITSLVGTTMTTLLVRLFWFLALLTQLVVFGICLHVFASLALSVGRNFVFWYCAHKNNSSLLLGYHVLLG
jgi:hypothetical protein